MADSTLSPDRLKLTLTLTLTAGTLTQVDYNVDIGNTLQADWGLGIPNSATRISRNQITYSSTSVTGKFHCLNYLEHCFNINSLDYHILKLYHWTNS